ncbi:MAG: NACHT domain-containing protein [Chloroflexota bacterium]|nr:NACHT domain-containing protein [Chloroflexota bacterium]
MSAEEKKPNHRLRFHREKWGWSQRKVAEQLDITEDKVSRWERGERTPSPYYREKLCTLFELNAIELGFIEEQNNNPMFKQHETSSKKVDTSRSASLTPSPLQTSYEALCSYLQQQQIHILDAIAPGSTNLRVGDILSYTNLFIPPLWEVIHGTLPSETSLINYLIDALIRDQRILLLGEAGQGKTTVLKQVFTLLTNQFLNTYPPTSPFPLYMPLRDFSYTKGNAAELIWSHISEEFPLAFEDFVLLLRNNQILFLFDGFDEIKGELTQTAINERAAGKIFARPSLLSCRKSFFDFYLSMSILQEYYPIWIELRPLEMDTHVEQYIATFCSQKQSKLAQNISPIEPIIQTIKGTPELQDLAQRPLLLIMMLDIFTDPKEVNEEIWNVAILYKKYTELWLKNEAAKLSSILKWNEKAGLLEEIAWITYSSQPPVAFLYSLNQSVTFTYIDIAAIIKNAASRYLSVTEAQILDDLCFRTLLLLSEGETYYFLHKSFQEYYAARYIFNCMRSREKYTNVVEKIEEVLQVR